MGESRFNQSRCLVLCLDKIKFQIFSSPEKMGLCRHVRLSVCVCVSLCVCQHLVYTFLSAHIFSVAYPIFFKFDVHIPKVNTFTVDIYMSRLKVMVKGQIDILSEYIHFGIHFFGPPISSQWLIISISYLLCIYLRSLPSQWIYIFQGQRSNRYFVWIFHETIIFSMFYDIHFIFALHTP